MVSQFEKSTLDLAVIGNCAFNALINRFGRVVWCCLPRFDSAPIFSRLLSGDEPPDCEKGFFDIEIRDFERSEQRYLPHSAILETKLFDKKGNICTITDFAPRFIMSGRYFTPKMFMRTIINEKGIPRIRIRVLPVSDYAKELCSISVVSYFSTEFNARLTTDVAVDFIAYEKWFLLNDRRYIVFGNDEPFRDKVDAVANEFLNMTKDYWVNFVKNLHLPLNWQEEVARAAITLKMCQVESSGAIVAAMTTSIPEEKNSIRNWDYRFCWLRDSYHIVQALNWLGATCTMENYINFIANVIPEEPKEIQPIYDILMGTELQEIECASLKGYRGMGPVRVGNDAFNQIQNDNYGNVLLSMLLVFYDSRLEFKNYENVFKRLEGLGVQASKVWNKKDAGIWELRNNNHVHTYTSVMCWACCDRLFRISRILSKESKAVEWEQKAEFIRSEIMERAWGEKEQSFMATLHFEGDDPHEERVLDASVLLLARLKFIDATHPKFVKTICTFWFIEALHSIGDTEKAREMFVAVLKLRNHVGLLSEDIDIDTRELWGNFPQAYSMVGIINTATALSESWGSVGL